jgi:KUP system potassium uptake protein
LTRQTDMAKELEDKLEPGAQEDKVPPEGGQLIVFSLTALGIVYGDIGTSPLYAVRACFQGNYAVPADATNILGVLSLIFWSLIIVISVKYLLYVMHAENRGEGGILALMALIHPSESSPSRKRKFLVAMGIFGAALIYGDGSITPAISVLSSVEGLEVATHFFKPYVIPITITILVLLFSFQRQGTRIVGSVFGPVMLFWFVVIGALGITGILHRPEVLKALSPLHGIRFFLANGWRGFLVLGIVFLVVTGGEALYADMGHFGKTPIRMAWFGLVLPALLLNYFGQGALLLYTPEAVRNPFYLLAPHWALYPLVFVSTVATVIASQAVISGAFSLTRQAIQLGYCPRMQIDHTSSEKIGQVYIGNINWALMLAAIGLVLGFKSSTNLAAAYGVAVSTTMVITTVLAYVVARDLWKWNRLLAAIITAGFLIPDFSFFTANLTKVDQGGWFPILVAVLVYTLMSTWNRGRQLLWDRLSKSRVPVEKYFNDFAKDPPERVKGTAVFLTGSTHGVPPALLYQLQHNKVLHEQVIFLTIITENIPYVWGEKRVEVEDLGENFYRVIARHGFMEDAVVPKILRWCKSAGLEVESSETSYFLGRETVIPSEEIGMSFWRSKLFAFMSRNSLRPTLFFHLPRQRVIELGVEVEL